MGEMYSVIPSKEYRELISDYIFYEREYRRLIAEITKLEQEIEDLKVKLGEKNLGTE